SDTIDGGDEVDSAPADSGPATCADGTWDHDRDPATACVAWSTCNAGTYVTNTPSATSDRSCAGCASGTFSASANATSCKAWSTCAAGTHVTTPGSAASDRQCTACAAGTYSSSANQSGCLPADACAAGTEQTSAGTPSAPPVCTPCEAGTHCPGGTTPKQICASGTWDHDSNPGTACAAWTACVAGQSVGVAGSATTDQTCTVCTSGSFSVTTNATTCTPWTDCAAGGYVSTLGSAASDRQCAACEAGTFSTTANVTSCTAWATCAPGTMVSASGSDLTDRQCAACPAGETSTTPNATACVPMPNPGDPCATGGQTFTRVCGNCGTQSASCSATNVVTEYDACSEPPNACPPGEKQDRTEGCENNILRSWTCDATCTWTPPAISCEEASRIFTVGSTVGATVLRPVTQLGDKIKRLTSGGPPCGVSTMTDTHYVYLEVRNPNATAAKVELMVTGATGHPTPDVLLAAYSALPGDANARKVCLSGADWNCFSNSAFESCLLGTKAPTIPANGSIWVYVGNFQAGDAPLTFNFSAKVTAL
ncbi:MAG: repeat domain protein, partial [Labilithrix sp.]|nr:repeat domain protein [Labilithrix sp.]